MAEKTLKKGLFITFEGPEASGKSTHSRLMYDLLKERGYDALYTREPGGTRVGEEIRKVLLSAKHLDIPPLTETLLFEASRAALIDKVIAPAIRKKKIVITDRFNDATIVYQGYAGGVPLADIMKIESVSIKNTKPDLTVLLDIDHKTGLAKIKDHRKDRMESKSLSFHKNVRKGYLLLAKKNKKRVKVVKTKNRVEDTFNEVKKEVFNVIRKFEMPKRGS